MALTAPVIVVKGLNAQSASYIGLLALTCLVLNNPCSNYSLCSPPNSVIPPSGPTPLFENNEAVIKIINNNYLTDRIHHLKIQQFATQEWKQKGLITLWHICPMWYDWKIYGLIYCYILYGKLN